MTLVLGQVQKDEEFAVLVWDCRCQNTKEGDIAKAKNSSDLLLDITELSHVARVTQQTRAG